MEQYNNASDSKMKSVDLLLNSILHEPTPLVHTVVPAVQTVVKRQRVLQAIDNRYNENRAPSLSHLSGHATLNLTDKEGRRYWSVEDVKFNRAFVEAITKSSDFKPGDVMMWVRPKKAVTEEERAMK